MPPADSVYKALVLDSPSAPAFASWSNTADPDAPEVFMDYYVYNITNVTDMINGGTPFVQEVG